METKIQRYSDYLISSAIIAVGLLFFVGYVWADTSSTSVDVGNAAPTISSLSFNNGNDLTLTENTLVHATATMTVTDSNGCSEITNVDAQLAFASSVGEATGVSCSPDANTCYKDISCTATTTGAGTCDGGDDTTVKYDCGFKVWYPARPTDASSPGLSNAIWYVTATSSDGTDTGVATNTGETIDVVTLNSLDISGSISYPSTAANSNTGGTNQTVTHTNTGNTAIDNQISGDVMCTDYSACTGDSFGPEQQKFDTSDVTYASLSNTLAATASPATIELALATTTATTSSVTDQTFWGIAIPDGQPTGTYTGQNTFDAVAD